MLETALSYFKTRRIEQNKSGVMRLHRLTAEVHHNKSIPTIPVSSRKHVGS